MASSLAELGENDGPLCGADGITPTRRREDCHREATSTGCLEATPAADGERLRGQVLHLPRLHGRLLESASRLRGGQLLHGCELLDEQRRWQRKIERILTELQRSWKRNLDHEGATTARLGTETTEHGQGRQGQEEVFSLWTERACVSRLPDRTSVLQLSQTRTLHEAVHSSKTFSSRT